MQAFRDGRDFSTSRIVRVWCEGQIMLGDSGIMPAYSRKQNRFRGWPLSEVIGIGSRLGLSLVCIRGAGTKE